MSQEAEKLTEADFEYVHAAIRAAGLYRYSVAGTPDKGMPCFQRLRFDGTNEDWLRILECVGLLDFNYSTNLRMGGKASPINMAKRIKEHSKEFLSLREAEERGGPLSDGELASLVSELASAKEKDERKNYSFATKFCAQLAPTRCPIYDSIVAEALGTWWAGKEQPPKRGGRNTIKSLLYGKGYQKYLEIYKEFQRGRTNGLTFRKIDWILWFAWEDRLKDFFDKQKVLNYKQRFNELHKKVRYICHAPES